MSDSEAETILREVVSRSEVDCRHGNKQSHGGEGEGEWAVMYVRLRFVAHLHP